MDEMNTMNEVMDTENTNMVPTQDENLVMTEDNIEETSGEETSGGVPAALIVSGVMLAGYAAGKLGEKLAEKVIRKVAPAIKAKVAGLKKHKGDEESEPVEVEVEATEVEPEEETK